MPYDRDSKLLFKDIQVELKFVRFESVEFENCFNPDMCFDIDVV
jgi:hypothetical protein